MTGPNLRDDGPTPGSIRLRHMKSAVITGLDGPTLVTALNAFFDAQGEAVLVATHHIADWEVLVLYAE